MTKRFRKILSTLCALALLLTCISAAFATEGGLQEELPQQTEGAVTEEAAQDGAVQEETKQEEATQEETAAATASDDTQAQAEAAPAETEVKE